MVGAAVALALFGGLFTNPPPGASVQKEEVGGWTSEIKTDRFTGVVTCRLRSGRATVSRGAAEFAFGRGINTAEAAYRIDEGPARSGRTAMMQVAMLGVRTISADISNQTGGRVHIPVAELSGASAVAIRPNTLHAPRTFSLAGLDEALASQRARGCDQSRAY